jgi:hypothetical protein
MSSVENLGLCFYILFDLLSKKFSSPPGSAVPALFIKWDESLFRGDILRDTKLNRGLGDFLNNGGV